MILEKFNLILYIKGCKIFINILQDLKKVSPQTKKHEDLKEKVTNNAGDLFNELYYIFKERYKEEKDVLNKKDIKKFNYTKLRLTNDYQCESKEEEKQTDKKPNKKKTT